MSRFECAGPRGAYEQSNSIIGLFDPELAALRVSAELSISTLAAHSLALECLLSVKLNIFPFIANFAQLDFECRKVHQV